MIFPADQRTQFWGSKSEISRGFTGVRTLRLSFVLVTTRPRQLAMKVIAPDDMAGSNETLEPKSSPSLQSGSQLAILAMWRATWGLNQLLGDYPLVNKQFTMENHDF